MTEVIRLTLETINADLAIERQLATSRLVRRQSAHRQQVC
jgi:hypothetical protein